jgi:hypothetical protein
MVMSMRELFELRGADPELLFSPYCWRVRLALLHKGLEFHSRPLCFTDKAPLACSGQQQVPVLRDGDSAGGSDYLVGGLFLWAWCLGAQPWAADSNVGAWFQRLLHRFERAEPGGQARAVSIG